jgi:hypothetical protein
VVKYNNYVVLNTRVEAMNRKNQMSDRRGKLGLRAVTYGATTALVMNLSGLTISLNSGAKHLAFDFGTKVMADSDAISYVPPYRGQPQRTEATGARGGEYFAPYRGAPVTTQGTGARGADDYIAPYRGEPTGTQGTGSRGVDSYAPPYRGEPVSTQGMGSRGGQADIPLTLTLLIPTDHTGRTISGHPTFFWNLSEKVNVPMEFTLVEPGVTQPIFVQRIAQPKVGINQVEMPKDLAELAQGKKYRWSVSLVRNDKRRSDDVYVQGWVERVAATPELKDKLAKATSDHQRAEIYAEKGVWYDSFAAISRAYQQNPTDKSISDERLSLLEQVGQKAVAKEERQRLTTN